MDDSPDVMAQYGPRTLAFRSYKLSMDGAYDLADIVRRGGIQKLQESLSKGDALTQHLAGLSLEEFNALPATEKVKFTAQVSSEVTQQLGQLAANVSTTAYTTAEKTVPHVLLILLVTVFEAYLEDVASAIYAVKPTLLDALEGKTLAQKNRIAGKRTEDRVHEAFYAKSLDWIAVHIFEDSLSIPFTDICESASTSPAELNKAKAIRNIHIHNSGLVDATFIKRTGDTSLAEGAYYPITVDYLVEMNKKMFMPCLGVDLTATSLYLGIPVA